MSIRIILILLVFHTTHAQEHCQEEALERFKELVSKNYLWRDRIESMEWKSLEDAIKYLREKGDRWTNITKLEEDKVWYSEAKMFGVGVRWDDEGVIIRVFKNSPAEKAGLREGDRILSVDGIEGKDLWSKTIRSVAVGSKISIVLKRDEEIMAFYITKGEFFVPPVEDVRVIQMDGKRIGYIALTNFTKPAIQEFSKGLNYINAQKVDALVLDLRNNSGGLVSITKGIADMLVGGNGIMFYLDSINGKMDVYSFKREEIYFKKPILVFVNRFTASAAELFTVLLKTYAKATVAGELTVGKYVGTNLYPLDSCGDVLRLVTFEMKLPNGNTITDDKGILPDCVIKAKGDDGLSMALGCLKEKISLEPSLAHP
ncbi:MAG: S41 family peptidase [Aquificaceae bacterium]